MNLNGSLKEAENGDTCQPAEPKVSSARQIHRGGTVSEQ